MEIIKDIIYVGVNDRTSDLFEGQYKIPDGIAYNSYVIIDEKIAICDTVDEKFAEEWLKNVENALQGREPDYLIVHHMEPDHSASVSRLIQKYPSITVASGQRSFPMLKAFYGVEPKSLALNEGDEISLGKHTLKVIGAPMVHWPEVIMTYDKESGALFSADAFGKFGALDCDDEWACEARRYYFGIVGKYGAQVQAVLKKLEGVAVKLICPLHGPVLCDNLDYYMSLYNTWSSYESESSGVAIMYTSVYGNTKKAVELLRDELIKNGCKNVSLTDLARDDMHEAIEDCFRYDRVIFATTTYNGDIFPFMRELIFHLNERGFKNKRVAFIENGTWAPVAVRKMKEMLSGCKNLSCAETDVKIMSALNDTSKEQIKKLAEEMAR